MKDTDSNVREASESRTLKRKQVAVACLACQKRKSKCDGNRPKCKTCIKKSTDCVFDADGDSRRTENLKRKVSALNIQAEEAASAIKRYKATISSYEAVVESLKSSSREASLDIIDALRNDANLDELVEFCKESASVPLARKAAHNQLFTSLSQESKISDLQTRLVEYEEFLQDLQASPPETVIEQLRMALQPPRVGLSVDFSNGTMLDSSKDKGRFRENQRYPPDSTTVERKGDMNFLLNPIVEVPKGSEYETWTSVVDDSAVVQNLLEVYFTWFHPLSPVFSESLFRKDMIQGKNQHCSRVLVNAILSLACYLPGSYDTERFIKNETAAKFLKEAENLFHDAPEPCLTNIATLTIMAAVEIQRCRFGPAWMYSRQASSMAMYLGLNQRPYNAESSKGVDLCWTFWTVFHLDQFTSAVFGRSPSIILHNVDIPVPADNTPIESGEWPGKNIQDENLKSRPCMQSRYMYFASKLSRIVNTALDAFYAAKYRYTPDTVFKIYKDYQSWYEEAQEDFHLEVITVPIVLVLYIWYHARVIALLKPLFDSGVANAGFNVQEICRTSATTIDHLFRCHVRTFQLRGMHNQIGVAVLEACSIHVRFYHSKQHGQKAQECLEMAVSTFEDLQSQLPRGGGIVLEIEGLIEASGIDLGPHITRSVYKPGETLLHPVDSMKRNEAEKPEWKASFEKCKPQRPNYDHFYKPRGT